MIKKEIKELAKSARDKLVKKHNKERKQLEADVRKVFSSAAGLNVLKYLKEQCGYQFPSVVLNLETKEVSVSSTIYNEARRNLYLDLRKMVSEAILIKVEVEQPPKGEDDA